MTAAVQIAAIASQLLEQQHSSVKLISVNRLAVLHRRHVGVPKDRDYIHKDDLVLRWNQREVNQRYERPYSPIDK